MFAYPCLSVGEMKAKAEQCDRLADQARDRLQAYTHQQLVAQSRDMADQLDGLEHGDRYRFIRDQQAD